MNTIFDQNGLKVSKEAQRLFDVLADLFLEWNNQINLSAIRDRESVFLKHFVDSLLPTKQFNFDQALIADLGTGGGFPSLPLAIIYPNSTIHAFDAVGKKLKVVQDMADQLGLGVKTFHGRLEKFGQDRAFRERYDVVTTRALAEWTTLLEYALPFVKIGGDLIAYQGPSIYESLKGSEKVITLLGGTIEKIWEESLGEERRVFLQIKKTKPTPKLYPRKEGIPKREPL